MKRVVAAIFVCTVFLLSACQAIFTYSPLSFLQRDISNLPPAQQVKVAEDALGSGDPNQMTEAYAAIVTLLETSNDPDLSLLAADLAFGASGMTELFTSVIQDAESLMGAPTEELTALLEGLDTDLIAEGAGHIQDAASADADITDTQYLTAGAALLASAVEQAGSFEDVADPVPADPWYQDVQDAEAFLIEGGAEDLLSMFGL